MLFDETEVKINTSGPTSNSGPVVEVTVIDERHQAWGLMMETISLAGEMWSASIKRG